MGHIADSRVNKARHVQEVKLRYGLDYGSDHYSGSQMFIWCMFTFLSLIYAYLTKF
jgi:hypothetical protein